MVCFCLKNAIISNLVITFRVLKPIEKTQKVSLFQCILFDSQYVSIAVIMLLVAAFSHTLILNEKETLSFECKTVIVLFFLLLLL